ncbi:rod shape-determining protein MreC [Gallibacterium anatis]|uniref:rod shape-determining protein MreC n=1 Tax=Gallibacterium anatis TaxID=750 RepID=UPI00053136DD|nr:rod shape-determining protein MreC [Gallibacterium anatis]KGQ42064.1 rod shape-determining protein MreC [Gallibacterium anatis IPDH697-78]
MKPIFSKSPSLGVRLVFATLLSVILMFSDGQTRNLLQLRSLLETAVSWIYYLANTPRSLLDGVSDNLVDTNTLQIENKVLKDQLLEKNADLLLLDQLKVENQRLRLLLNSPLRHDEYKKIAEVLTAETDPYRQQVVINRGEKDGAYVGQPVIDEKGVVGQIISVGQNTSRILLISDVTHSIPLQVLRSDIRVIASGTGRADELVLDNVSRSADIEKGDLLVTSGLGHRFPEGYPVAIVESVSREGNNYFATVVAKPLASLERLRYLLLLWPTNEDIKRLHNSPNQIKEVVKQRLSSSQQNNDENKSGNEENDPPLEQRQLTPAKEKIEEE